MKRLCRSDRAPDQGAQSWSSAATPATATPDAVSGRPIVPPRAAGRVVGIDPGPAARCVAGPNLPDEMMSAPNLLLNVNGIEVIYNHVALVLKDGLVTFGPFALSGLAPLD